MSRLKVAETNDYLLLDEKPFFYLADTAWMAFANLTEERWQEYLAYRRIQGFNVLQISILPVTHDTSMSEENLDPFDKNADGSWDFFSYNQDYFDKAKRMVAQAVSMGFVPNLGVLWCSYVPNTRCSSKSPVPSAMPFNAVNPYAKHVATLFREHDPLFFISGDTKFESEEESAYYMEALGVVRSVCPDSLISMHLHPLGDLPEEFMKSVDFYMYQSGHWTDRQDFSYLHAQKFRKYPIKRPIVNSEPCYEAHGRLGQNARFSSFDVRKAVWQSILSGAKMGVAYGAHGIWSFHRRGMRFLNADRSFEPLDWDRALHLEGAWDVAFAHWIYKTFGLHDIEPSNALLNDDPEIVMAASPDLHRIAIYSPYTIDIKIDLDLTGYSVTSIILNNRRTCQLVVEVGKQSTIRMQPFNSDILILAIKL